MVVLFPIFANVFAGAITWSEAVTALATIASAAILLAGLFVASSQLTALNRATQLENFVALSQEMATPRFAEDFESSLRADYDPRVKSLRVNDPKELERLQRVIAFFERIATLVERKYLDEKLAIDWFGAFAKDVYNVVGSWIEVVQHTNPYWNCELTSFVRKCDAHWKKIGHLPVVPRVKVRRSSD